jgi:hypothetical protein
MTGGTSGRLLLSSFEIINRTLKTRPQMIAMLNTFTREEMEMVMNHIEYIIKETVTNITGELPNDNKDAGKNGW